jgi:hypothetical protein
VKRKRIVTRLVFVALVAILAWAAYGGIVLADVVVPSTAPPATQTTLVPSTQVSVPSTLTPGAETSVVPVTQVSLPIESGSAIAGWQVALICILVVVAVGVGSFFLWRLRRQRHPDVAKDR